MSVSLFVRQQPLHARACGSGDKPDRRPVDPPIIVQLISSGSQEVVADPITCTYFCFASLINSSTGASFPAYPTQSPSSMLTGTILSSLFYLKDPQRQRQGYGEGNESAGFFVFGDLNVRTEGIYKLRFDMFEVRGRHVNKLSDTISDEFTVYSAKRFPGMSGSTELSKSFAEQGMKLRIRKDIRMRKKLRHYNDGLSQATPEGSEDEGIERGERFHKQSNRPEGTLPSQGSYVYPGSLERPRSDPTDYSAASPGHIFPPQYANAITQGHHTFQNPSLQHRMYPSSSFNSPQGYSNASQTYATSWYRPGQTPNHNVHQTQMQVGVQGESIYYSNPSLPLPPPGPSSSSGATIASAIASAPAAGGPARDGSYSLPSFGEAFSGYGSQHHQAPPPSSAIIKQDSYLQSSPHPYRTHAHNVQSQATRHEIPYQHRYSIGPEATDANSSAIPLMSVRKSDSYNLNEVMPGEIESVQAKHEHS